MQLLNDPVFKIVAECTRRVLYAAHDNPYNLAASLTYTFIMAHALSDQFAVPFEDVLRALNVPEPIIAKGHEKTPDGTPLHEALTRFNA